MTREPIEVTRQDRIYCLKASSDYHSEVCEECKFYPNCDHMTQDDMTELTIKDLEALEQEPILDKIRAEIEQLPINGRTNWDGCCPDIDYPVIEYVDISKDKLLSIIDKYKVESEKTE